MQCRKPCTKILDLNEPYPDLNQTLIALSKHEQSQRQIKDCQQTPQLEQRRGGKGVDSFVL